MNHRDHREHRVAGQTATTADPATSFLFRRLCVLCGFKSSSCLRVFVFLLLCTTLAHARATQPNNTTPALGGVAITPDGLMQIRQTPAPRLIPKKDPTLTYISLAQLSNHLQQLQKDKAPLPKELRYLQGLT